MLLNACKNIGLAVNIGNTKYMKIGTQSKVRIGNYLSSSFPIENGLKQVDALLPLPCNFSLEYAIRKGQEINLG